MKNNKFIIALLCGLFFLPQLSHSQNEMIIMKRHRPHNGQGVVFFNNDGTSDTTVIILFEENAPERFNAPKTPSFALMGKQKKFMMGIGGYVKGSISMDVNGAIKDPAYFTTSEIPIPSIPGDENLLQFNANQTTLFYSLVSTSNAKHKFGAYINMNFSGLNMTPVLKDAYVTYNGFLMGYTTSLFTDAAAIPPTIDAEGPNGMTLLYNTVLNYRHQFGKHWSVALGLEMPIADFTVEPSVQRASNQYVPDIPAYIQYAWGQGNNSHIRLSGVLRNANYRNILDSKNKFVTGFGAQLSGLATIAQKVVFYYQISTGSGLSTYIQDLTGLGLELVPDHNADNQYNNGNMTATDVMSYYAGLQYNFNPRTFISATFSQVVVDLPNNFTDSHQYKEGYYLASNFFWYAMPNVQLGLEYLYGKRVNQDKDWGQANRFQFMIQYNF